MSGPSIVWFRDDLRLADNPALEAAIERGQPLIPLFIQDDAAAAAWATGAAARWWLGQSLAELDRSLSLRGAGLVRRRGDSLTVLQALIAETGADALFWNRRYSPHGVAQDTVIKATLKDRGLAPQSFKAALLVEPMAFGGPPNSFSAFFARWRPLAWAKAIEPVPERIDSIDVASQSLQLLPGNASVWTAKLAAHWQVGERAAERRLARFLKEQSLERYGTGRHLPAADAVSGLSPHLHAGEMAPDAILRAVPEGAGFAFIRQLAWREYAACLLFFEPRLPERELMAERRAIAWRQAPEEVLAWQRGETGFDLVDAGMRQLWATGWMHNRLRMVVASFLAKHLLIDWRQGQRWFWETLVDADLASNAMGWQWAASVGADATAIVRIFNPETQAEKVDPDGTYRQRWLCPGPRPQPIVEHRAARRRALRVYAEAMA